MPLAPVLLAECEWYYAVRKAVQADDGMKLELYAAMNDNQTVSAVENRSSAPVTVYNGTDLLHDGNRTMTVLNASGGIASPDDWFAKVVGAHKFQHAGKNARCMDVEIIQGFFGLPIVMHCSIRKKQYTLTVSERPQAWPNTCCRPL